LFIGIVCSRYAMQTCLQRGGVKISVRRFGALDGVIGAALYLCSDASASMTGVCLPVDGGTLATL